MEKKLLYVKPKCQKCGSEKLSVEARAKEIKPLIYQLYDRITCKECGLITNKDIREVDNGNENTRKLITGNYIVDKFGKVVPKKDTPLKKLVKKVNEEIDVDRMFPT